MIRGFKVNTKICICIAVLYISNAYFSTTLKLVFANFINQAHTVENSELEKNLQCTKYKNNKQNNVLTSFLNK